MSAEYPPGTVAKVTVRHRGATLRDVLALRVDADGWRGVANFWGDETGDVTDVRPLVVLDPGDSRLSTFRDRSRLDRYIAEISADGRTAAALVLEAVYEQILPTVTEAEPGLYGAVRARVKRDTSQTVFEWFRGKDGWVSDFGNRADWDQLIVLEVLSEGRAA